MLMLVVVTYVFIDATVWFISFYQLSEVNLAAWLSAILAGFQ